MPNPLKHALLVAAATLAGPAVAQPVDPLVGTWKLVRFVDASQPEVPDDDPIGYFMFTADGHASISILSNPRGSKRPMMDVAPEACSPAWYCSYFGTYTLDPEGGAWTIKVEGGNIPTFLGTEQRRRFRISGDHLLVEEIQTASGIRVRAERQLVRAK